jgi:hypothetical protein
MGEDPAVEDIGGNIFHDKRLDLLSRQKFLRDHIPREVDDLVPVLCDNVRPLPYAKRLPKERSNAEPVSKSPDRRGKAQVKAPFRQKGNIFIRSGRRCQNSTGRQDNIRPSFLLQGRPPFGGKISKTEQIGKIKTLQPRLTPCRTSSHSRSPTGPSPSEQG